MRVAQEKPPYQIIQLPKVESPVPPQPINGTPTATPDIMGLLDQQVMGIPVKYLLIGAAAYFLMKK